MNRDPRSVGQAYKHLMRLFEVELAEEPSLETVLSSVGKPALIPYGARHA